MASWKEISTNEEWEQALQNSDNKALVVLKHSTACPVSFNALQEYEAYLGKSPNTEVDYLLVKVIESRPVSNQIAEDTGVKHASPQVLYVKNKETVWNTSHWAITEEHLNAVLN
ncbi:bacillithiol system redox-active protein YtxJ [Paenibacillus puerhi]|uniref:bacillithiol system redox-active protein YtxJ n=1 Tax=Paenibacillus puerhi TaxID=2692622 RepID=UPI00135713BC|nr:bacillithiol system redox-active protein YtxJ [Paenibacillus puerhi]